MREIDNIESALLLFVNAANNHAEASEVGNYKIGNKCHAEIMKAISFLKDRGRISELLIFLDHDSVGVRLWAATYLLPIAEREGVKALEEIAKETGIHSFNAKLTIREWRNGNLKL